MTTDQIVALTPDLAAVYLDTVPGPLNQGLINSYVMAMQDNNFRAVSIIVIPGPVGNPLSVGTDRAV